MGRKRRDMRQLRLLRLQKFLARGSIEEKIAHLQRRARRNAAIGNPQNLATRNFHFCADGFFRRASGQMHPRHRCNRRKRLAAKSQRRQLQQIVAGMNLRGRMTLKGQQRIIAHHAAAIIGDANQFAAARFHVNANPLGACIERIFQQLLHHRRRPLHHLAGSNLVRHLIGKNADVAHKEPIVGRLRNLVRLCVPTGLKIRTRGTQT